MTEHRPDTSPDDGVLPEGLPVAALLRALADGERLSDRDAQRLSDRPEAERAHDDRRIAFERSLREAVAQTLGAAEDARAPQGLQASVLAALRAEPDDGVVRSSLGDTRSRSFWAPIGRFAAVAAVLALAAGVVFSGLRATTGPNPANQRASLVASFVHQQHESCPNSGKFTATSLDEALSAAARELGHTPDAFDKEIRALEGVGYQFVGLGACRVPGDGASVHLYFRSAEPDGPHISLFIQLEPADFDAVDGHDRCYIRDCSKGGPNKLVLWQEGDLVHYLCTSDDEALAVAQASFGAPDDLTPLR
jgi:hypothetical protein